MKPIKKPLQLPIYLIGYMGAGKTTAGRLLAERLGWHFVDLDEAFAEIHGESFVEKSEQERRKALVEFALPKNIAGLESDLRYRRWIPMLGR